MSERIIFYTDTSPTSNIPQWWRNWYNDFDSRYSEDPILNDTLRTMQVINAELAEYQMEVGLESLQYPHGERSLTFHSPEGKSAFLLRWCNK